MRTATNGTTVNDSKYSGPGRSEVSANEHTSSSAFLSRICAVKGTKNVCVLLIQEGAILNSALLLTEVVGEPGLDVPRFLASYPKN